MDVESGRIYPPDEYAERLSAKDVRRRLDEHQEQFEARLAQGQIVEVSDQVALQQLAGQEALARKARRKAAKTARKRNRS